MIVAEIPPPSWLRRVLARVEGEPPTVDFQGNQRCAGYRRGISSLPCRTCRTEGEVAGKWRPDCGGYGDVPHPAEAAP